MLSHYFVGVWALPTVYDALAALANNFINTNNTRIYLDPRCGLTTSLKSVGIFSPTRKIKS